MRRDTLETGKGDLSVSRGVDVLRGSLTDSFPCFVFDSSMLLPWHLLVILTLLSMCDLSWHTVREWWAILKRCVYAPA